MGNYNSSVTMAECSVLLALNSTYYGGPTRYGWNGLISLYNYTNATKGTYKSGYDAFYGTQMANWGQELNKYGSVILNEFLNFGAAEAAVTVTNPLGVQQSPAMISGLSNILNEVFQEYNSTTGTIAFTYGRNIYNNFNTYKNTLYNSYLALNNSASTFDYSSKLDIINDGLNMFDSQSQTMKFSLLSFILISFFPFLAILAFVLQHLLKTKAILFVQWNAASASLIVLIFMGLFSSNTSIQVYDFCKVSTKILDSTPEIIQMLTNYKFGNDSASAAASCVNGYYNDLINNTVTYQKYPLPDVNAMITQNVNFYSSANSVSLSTATSDNQINLLTDKISNPISECMPSSTDKYNSINNITNNSSSSCAAGLTDEWVFALSQCTTGYTQNPGLDYTQPACYQYTKYMNSASDIDKRYSKCTSQTISSQVVPMATYQQGVQTAYTGIIQEIQTYQSNNSKLFTASKPFVKTMIDGQTALLAPMNQYTSNQSYNCSFIKNHIQRVHNLICEHVKPLLQISWFIISAMIIMFLLQVGVGYAICYTTVDVNEEITDPDLKAIKESMELLGKEKKEEAIN